MDTETQPVSPFKKGERVKVNLGLHFGYAIVEATVYQSYPFVTTLAIESGALAGGFTTIENSMIRRKGEA